MALSTQCQAYRPRRRAAFCRTLFRSFLRPVGRCSWPLPLKILRSPPSGQALTQERRHSHHSGTIAGAPAPHANAAKDPRSATIMPQVLDTSEATIAASMPRVAEGAAQVTATSAPTTPLATFKSEKHRKGEMLHPFGSPPLGEINWKSHLSATHFQTRS